MSKLGRPLAEIDGISDTVVRTLRDNLSVTTAQEFVGLATRYPSSLEEILQLDASGLVQLTELVRDAMTPAERNDLDELGGESESDYSYATGHDAPEGARTYFDPAEEDEPDD